MKMLIKSTLALCACAFLFSVLFPSCQSGTAEQTTKSGLIASDFQKKWQGVDINLYTLTNDNGMEVCVTNYGGRIVSIMVPDKDGVLRDVCVGMANIADYTTFESDFGASVGRYANRIAQSKITVDSVEYTLVENNFGHCLHGGCTLDSVSPLGWQYLPYEVDSVATNMIRLKIVGNNGEAGFPGTVTAFTTYTLTPDNAIDIKWEATTDAKTYVNQTNHTYFNLNGDPSMPITNIIMQINADYFTPVDSTFMTTGEIAPVTGTPMDFTQPKEIGKDIKNFDFDQIKNGNGFDHNWVLNAKGDDSVPCVVAKSPVTGIVLEVFTNEPGIQFYTGNFLNGTVPGKGGVMLNQHAGFCLETQKFPDTPNKSHLPGWPSATLLPGETYHSHCVYKFSHE